MNILNDWMIGALHDCKTTNWSQDKGVDDCQSLASMLINFHHTTQTPQQICIYSVPWFIGTEFLHLKHDPSENHFCKPHPRDLGPLQGTTLGPPVSAKVPNLHPALAVDMVAKPPMAATHNSAETVLTAYQKDMKG